MNDTPTPKHPGGRPPMPEGRAASSQIHLRVTRRRKSAYVRAAKPGTLAAWCFGHLDRAADYTEEAPKEEKPNE